MESEAAGTPHTPEPHYDATGLELSVGRKVAWGVGGRYNYGLAMGVITNLIDNMAERDQYDYATQTTKKVPVRVRIVEVRTIMAGRQGRQFHPQAPEGRFPVVSIMDQSYEGNR